MWRPDPESDPLRLKKEVVAVRNLEAFPPGSLCNVET